LIGRGVKQLAQVAPTDIRGFLAEDRFERALEPALTVTGCAQPRSHAPPHVFADQPLDREGTVVLVALRRFVGDEIDPPPSRAGHLVSAQARRLESDVLVAAQRQSPDASALDPVGKIPCLAAVDRHAQCQPFAAHVWLTIGIVRVRLQRVDGFGRQRIA
jgi:hypothetical protein